MAQHRDYRYGRGQQDELRSQRWRPAEHEGAQRASGGWGERPYSQNEYRTEHPEDFQRGHAQRGYGQDDREAWPSEAGGYQGGPWSSEEYGQGGSYGPGQGGYGQGGGAGQGGYGYGQGAQRQGRYGQGDYGNYGQGNYGQGNYGQGNYGQGNYGQGNYGQSDYGQGNYGRGGFGRYARGGEEQGWGSGSYGASQGGYGQGGFGAGQEGFGQGRSSGQGGYGMYGPGGSVDYRSQGGAYSTSQRARRGPKGYKRSDERLKEDISERLMNSVHIDAAEVSVEVQNGKVTLEGTVPERRMKHQIEDLVDNCPGVQDIDNRVRVARGESDAAESGTSTSGTGTSSTGAFGSSGSSRKKE